MLHTGPWIEYGTLAAVALLLIHNVPHGSALAHKSLSRSGNSYAAIIANEAILVNSVPANGLAPDDSRVQQPLLPYPSFITLAKELDVQICG
jgi:hypothetical protein